MKATIKYKARIAWTDDAGNEHKDAFCHVVHQVEQLPDGSWKTTSLKWGPSKPREGWGKDS